MPDSRHASPSASPRPRSVTDGPDSVVPAARHTTQIFAKIWRLPALSLSAVIWLYQQLVSPALTALNPTCGCRFAPTCSHYARQALHTHGFVIGTLLTLVRLAKCGPWHPGGEDPVPSRKFSCVRVQKATPAQS